MKTNVLPVTAGALGSLALAVSATGQFINVTIVPYFPVGAPAGSETFRVVAHYVGQTIVLSWGAVPQIGMLDFYTYNNVPLLNDPNSPFAGLKQEDFAQFPIGADWDSWVTVGATGFAGNQTDYTTGFIGSDGVTAAVVGNAFNETDGLVFDSDPTSPILVRTLCWPSSRSRWRASDSISKVSWARCHSERRARSSSTRSWLTTSRRPAHLHL